MKALFQVLCSTDYDWDDELTPDLLSWWNRLIADMNALKTIRVPRCYFSWKADDPVGHQLHGFSDASCKAYAAVVYLSTEHANGDIEVNLQSVTLKLGTLTSKRHFLIYLWKIHL